MEVSHSHHEGQNKALSPRWWFLCLRFWYIPFYSCPFLVELYQLVFPGPCLLSPSCSSDWPLLCTVAHHPVTCAPVPTWPEDSLTLEVETVCSSRVFLIAYQTVWCHICRQSYIFAAMKISTQLIVHIPFSIMILGQYCGCGLNFESLVMSQCHSGGYRSVSFFCDCVLNSKSDSACFVVGQDGSVPGQRPISSTSEACCKVLP